MLLGKCQCTLLYLQISYKSSAAPSQVTMQTFWLCSSVFESCHKHVPFQPFWRACTDDTCHGNDTCSSLEAYATECAEAGICIDWRNATNGQCGKIMLC